MLTLIDICGYFRVQVVVSLVGGTLYHSQPSPVAIREKLVPGHVAFFLNLFDGVNDGYCNEILVL